MRDALKFDSDCSAFTGLTSSRVKPCAEEPPLSGAVDAVESQVTAQCRFLRSSLG